MTGSSVGIKDVAREAGVSITTVSHALNGKGRIPENTRRRVKGVADRLGYEPNAIARSLAGGRTGVIAIAFSIVDAVPLALTDVDYFGQAIGEATKRALEHDVALVIGPPTSRSRLWSRIPLDGVVLFDPVVADPVLASLRRRDLPLVIVGRDPGGAGGDYCVDNDHIAGTRTVLDHLAQRGARRVALLGGALDDSYTHDCVAGYLAWCKDHRTQPLCELVPPFDAAAHEVLARWFAMPDRPDAIYANFDALGSVTLRAAGEHGLGVPRDLLVAVCADRESFEGVAVEPTTLNLNPGPTATEAVELLIDVIQGRPPAEPTRIIPTRLVTRASTAR